MSAPEQVDMFGAPAPEAKKTEPQSEWGRLWDEVAAAAKRSKDAYDAVKTAIETKKGWKLLDVEDGVFWRARHKDYGQVRASSGEELIAAVAALIAERTAKRRKLGVQR